MPVYQESDAGADFAVIEEYSVLDCEVESVEERDSIFKDDEGNTKRTVAFKFKVLTGEHENRRLWGDTPTTWSSDERCKLRMWSQQIMNRTYAKGEPLDTDDLVGRHCRAVVGVRTKKATGDKTNYVSDVLPTKGVAVSAAQAYEEPF